MYNKKGWNDREEEQSDDFRSRSKKQIRENTIFYNANFLLEDHLFVLHDPEER